MSAFLEIISIVFIFLYFIGGFLLSLWWIWIPWLLFILARDIWIKHVRNKFAQDLEWVLLEVRPPQDVKKTPHAIEQLFAGLHGMLSGPSKKDELIKGVFQRWFSFEIVGNGGDIRFLVRTLTYFRNLVESQIYAQYPEAEIIEVDDYINSVPNDIPNEEYNLWGTEMVLLKEDAYPIRTYVEFEKSAVSEEQRIDPISSLLEVMSKLENKEQIWVQTLIRPVNDEWKKQGDKLRDKLIGRKEENKEGEVKKEFIAWKDAFGKVLHELATGESLEPSDSNDKKEKFSFLWDATKGEQDIITAIERNTAKIGFETIIRFVYVSPRDTYSMANVSAVVGCFKQFNTQNLNGFKPNGKISPSLDYALELKDQREDYRRRRVFKDYRKRDFVQYSDVIKYLNRLSFEKLPIFKWFFDRSNPMVLNIEELATVYHFPSEPVKAPLVPRVEAKKGEPPIGLPIK